MDIQVASAPKLIERVRHTKYPKTNHTAQHDFDVMQKQFLQSLNYVCTSITMSLQKYINNYKWIVGNQKEFFQIFQKFTNCFALDFRADTLQKYGLRDSFKNNYQKIVKTLDLISKFNQSFFQINNKGMNKINIVNLIVSLEQILKYCNMSIQFTSFLRSSIQFYFKEFQSSSYTQNITQTPIDDQEQAKIFDDLVSDMKSSIQQCKLVLAFKQTQSDQMKALLAVLSQKIKKSQQRTKQVNDIRQQVKQRSLVLYNKQRALVPYTNNSLPNNNNQIALNGFGNFNYIKQRSLAIPFHKYQKKNQIQLYNQNRQLALMNNERRICQISNISLQRLICQRYYRLLLSFYWKLVKKDEQPQINNLSQRISLMFQNDKMFFFRVNFYLTRSTKSWGLYNGMVFSNISTLNIQIINNEYDIFIDVVFNNQQNPTISPWMNSVFKHGNVINFQQIQKYFSQNFTNIHQSFQKINNQVQFHKRKQQSLHKSIENVQNEVSQILKIIKKQKVSNIEALSNETQVFQKLKQIQNAITSIGSDTKKSRKFEAQHQTLLSSIKFINHRLNELGGQDTYLQQTKKVLELNYTDIKTIVQKNMDQCRKDLRNHLQNLKSFILQFPNPTQVFNSVFQNSVQSTLKEMQSDIKQIKQNTQKIITYQVESNIVQNSMYNTIQNVQTNAMQMNKKMNQVLNILTIYNNQNEKNKLQQKDELKKQIYQQTTHILQSIASNVTQFIGRLSSFDNQSVINQTQKIIKMQFDKINLNLLKKQQVQQMVDAHTNHIQNIVNSGNKQLAKALGLNLGQSKQLYNKSTSQILDVINKNSKNITNYLQNQNNKYNQGNQKSKLEIIQQVRSFGAALTPIVVATQNSTNQNTEYLKNIYTNLIKFDNEIGVIYSLINATLNGNRVIQNNTQNILSQNNEIYKALHYMNYNIQSSNQNIKKFYQHWSHSQQYVHSALNKLNQNNNNNFSVLWNMVQNKTDQIGNMIYQSVNQNMNSNFENTNNNINSNFNYTNNSINSNFDNTNQNLFFMNQQINQNIQNMSQQILAKSQQLKQTVNENKQMSKENSMLKQKNLIIKNKLQLIIQQLNIRFNANLSIQNPKLDDIKKFIQKNSIQISQLKKSNYQFELGIKSLMAMINGTYNNKWQSTFIQYIQQLQNNNKKSQLTIARQVTQKQLIEKSQTQTKQKINNFERKNQNLQKEKKRIQQQLISKTNQLTKIKTQYQNIENNVSDLKNKVKRLTQENSSLQNQAQILKNDYSIASFSLNHKNAQNMNKQNQLEQLRNSKNKNQSQIKKLENQLSDLKVQINQKKNQTKRLSQSAKTHINQLNQNKEKIKQLQQIIKKKSEDQTANLINIQYQKSKIKIKNIQQKNSEITKQLQYLKSNSEIKKYTNQIEEQRKRINQYSIFKSKNQELQKQIFNNKKQIEQLNQSKQRFIKESERINNFQKENTQFKNQNKKFKQQVQRKNEKIKELQIQIIQKKKDIQNYVQKQKNNDNSIKIKQNQIQNYKKKVEKINQLNKQLQIQRAQKQNKVKQYQKIKQQLQEKDKQFQKKDKQLLKNQTQLNKLQSQIQKYKKIQMKAEELMQNQNQKNTQLTQLKENSNKILTQNQNLQKQMKKKKQQILTKDSQIQALKNTNKRLQQQYEQYSQQNTKLKIQNTKIQSQFNQKNFQISKKKKQVQTLKLQFQKVKQIVKQKQSNINDQKIKNQEKQKIINNIKQKMQQNRRLIEIKQQQQKKNQAKYLQLSKTLQNVTKAKQQMQKNLQQFKRAAQSDAKLYQKDKRKYLNQNSTIHKFKNLLERRDQALQASQSAIIVQQQYSDLVQISEQQQRALLGQLAYTLEYRAKLISKFKQGSPQQKNLKKIQQKIIQHLTELRSQNIKNKAQLEKLKQESQKLNGEVTKLTKKLNSTQNNLKQQINEKQENNKRISEKLTRLNQQKHIIQNQLQQLKQNLKKTTKQLKQKTILIQQMQRISDAQKSKIKDLQTQMAKASAKQIQISTLAQQLKNKTQQILKLQKQVQESKKTKAIFNQLQQRVWNEQTNNQKIKNMQNQLKQTKTKILHYKILQKRYDNSKTLRKAFAKLVSTIQTDIQRTQQKYQKLSQKISENGELTQEERKLFSVYVNLIQKARKTLNQIRKQGQPLKGQNYQEQSTLNSSVSNSRNEMQNENQNEELQNALEKLNQSNILAQINMDSQQTNNFYAKQQITTPSGFSMKKDFNKQNKVQLSQSFVQNYQSGHQVGYSLKDQQLTNAVKFLQKTVIFLAKIILRVSQQLKKILIDVQKQVNIWFNAQNNTNITDQTDKKIVKNIFLLFTQFQKHLLSMKRIIKDEPKIEDWHNMLGNILTSKQEIQNLKSQIDSIFE